MSLNVLSCRPTAAIVPLGANRYLIQAAVLRECLAKDGRPVAQMFKVEDCEIRPGSIYMAPTGLIFPDIAAVAQLPVRASEQAWKSGLLVHRTDFVGQHRELVVWFSVFQPLKFVRGTPIFEVEPQAVAVTAPAASRMPPAAATPNLPGPGEVLLQPQAERRLAPAPSAQAPATAGPRPATEAAQQAAAVQAVNAWLNSPDERGRIVATPDTPTLRPLPTHRASSVEISTAAPEQRIDDRDMSSVDPAAAQNPERDQAMRQFATGAAITNPMFINDGTETLVTEVSLTPPPPPPPPPAP